MQPFVQMNQMTRIEPDAKKWIAKMRLDDGMQFAAGHTDADGFVPLDDGAEIRRDQFLEVILHSGGQVAFVLQASQPPRAFSAPQMP